MPFVTIARSLSGTWFKIGQTLCSAADEL